MQMHETKFTQRFKELHSEQFTEDSLYSNVKKKKKIRFFARFPMRVSPKDHIQMGEIITKATCLSVFKACGPKYTLSSNLKFNTRFYLLNPQSCYLLVFLLCLN